MICRKENIWIAGTNMKVYYLRRSNQTKRHGKNRIHYARYLWKLEHKYEKEMVKEHWPWNDSYGKLSSSAQKMRNRNRKCK